MVHFEDAASIAEVLYESFSEYRSAYLPAAFAATVLTREQVIGRMAEGPMWVAVKETKIVGPVSVVERGSEGYVRGMAVLPSARGEGIGQLLMRQVELFALEHGCHRLILSTTPFLMRAIQLYERAGFRQSSEGPKDLFGTPLLSMVKTLWH